MQYSFDGSRASTVVSLTQDTLTVEEKRGVVSLPTRIVPFSAIRRVSLYPGDFAWNCEVTPRKGRKVTIPSATWQANRLVNQHDAYRAFVVELHRALVSFPDVQFLPGIRLLKAIFLVVSLTMIVSGVFFVAFALVEMFRYGLGSKEVFVLAIGVLITVAGSFKALFSAMGLAQRYRPEALPESLLPPDDGGRETGA